MNTGILVTVLRLSVQLVQPNQFHLAAARGIGELTGEPCAGEADQARVAGVVLLGAADEITDPAEPGRWWPSMTSFHFASPIAAVPVQAPERPIQSSSVASG
jgi:hypothetical protein